MALKGRFRGGSRKKSSAGTAFNKGRRNHDTSGLGRFGNIDFLKRLLGKTGLDMQAQNSSGVTELLLMAQLGDMDAIQLLAGGGMDAKDNLGLSSLAMLAMTGDMDAVRLLETKGLSLSAKKEEDSIEHHAALMRGEFGEIVYAVEARPEETHVTRGIIENTDSLAASARAHFSVLKEAISAVSEKGLQAWRGSSEPGRPLLERPAFAATKPLA